MDGNWFQIKELLQKNSFGPLLDFNPLYFKVPLFSFIVGTVSYDDWPDIVKNKNMVFVPLLLQCCQNVRRPKAKMTSCTIVMERKAETSKLYYIEPDVLRYECIRWWWLALSEHAHIHDKNFNIAFPRLAVARIL